jgi:hypothetical protein
MTGSWRACAPELVIATILVTATTAAVYGYDGAAAAGLVLTGWTIAILVVLRLLVPPATATAPDEDSDRRIERAGSSFIGFWRKRGTLADATASMASYDAQLRQTLEHLLAARLAARHGISLYTDPEAARSAFADGGRYESLWHWLDPARPRTADQDRRGIPLRTLTAIIDRLERL